ncbi:MAG: adenosylcobinamide-phosphate synthase CbiB [Paenibacillaceae bacterium]
MLFYSLQEITLMLIAAIIIDWLIGDPNWPTHPVIYMGRLIRRLEKRLRSNELPLDSAKTIKSLKIRGFLLCFLTIGICYGLMWAILVICNFIHPWLGYAVNTWFISTTIAIKGLKDAGLLVYRPLQKANLTEARTYVGYIVGRDTIALSEPEVVRATVETIAENIVDAVVSPLVYALLGGAPLALLYRASNTLDSMVGYKNDTYLHFGRASARWDDLLNWIPARITGLLLVVSIAADSTMSTRHSWKAIRVFAHLHPSPNSGIPESAVAGALGVELGGRNFYAGVPNDRARMGWSLRVLSPADIVSTIKLLYRVSYLSVGGLACTLFVLWL